MPESTLSEAIAENVRREMAIREWSQTDLATKAHISQSRVSELLSGRHSPRLETIEKIAKALGLSPYAILAPLAAASP